MAFSSWCRLLILEHKLNGICSPFGKYNRYRRLCLERNSKTTEEKLDVAREVLNGPGVNTLEAQDNELYIRRNEKQKREVKPLRAVGETPPDAQPSLSKEA